MPPRDGKPVGYHDGKVVYSSADLGLDDDVSARIVFIALRLLRASPQGGVHVFTRPATMSEHTDMRDAEMGVVFSLGGEEDPIPFRLREIDMLVESLAEAAAKHQPVTMLDKVVAGIVDVLRQSATAARAGLS